MLGLSRDSDVMPVILSERLSDTDGTLQFITQNDDRDGRCYP